MGELFARIRRAVSNDTYLVGLHAADRLAEHGIPLWQVVAGLAEGQLLRERPREKPNAVVEVLQCLPDGTEIKAVWSWLAYDERAKLVTVHYQDR